MYPLDEKENWFSGKGHWSKTLDEDWFNWKWQMRNRLTKKEHFERFIQLTEHEISRF